MRLGLRSTPAQLTSGLPADSLFILPVEFLYRLEMRGILGDQRSLLQEACDVFHPLFLGEILDLRQQFLLRDSIEGILDPGPQVN